MAAGTEPVKAIFAERLVFVLEALTDLRMFAPVCVRRAVKGGMRGGGAERGAADTPGGAGLGAGMRAAFAADTCAARRSVGARAVRGRVHVIDPKFGFFWGV